MKENRLANLFWEGITLEHVNHKGIVYPYIMFMLVAFVFEMFLTILIGISIYYYIQFSYYPNTSFYLLSTLLLLLLITTGITLKSLYHKCKQTEMLN
ncbi:hypothetical protein [Bacillus sp. B1-b2]|uniref:hypothetical protein n=1 Tax=Bacillus sp. B1-b2 TaxID=2653201 RepID=UPI0012620170|nr:hypothetical protein [Bacillus sp. B1-b2]KAB7668427.1 hypothetical protein F9279_13500 [Bacillus sp. B1-b2]